jgi:hypothetical protein
MNILFLVATPRKTREKMSTSKLIPDGGVVLWWWRVSGGVCCVRVCRGGGGDFCYRDCRSDPMDFFLLFFHFRVYLESHGESGSSCLSGGEAWTITSKAN